jgi:hypothetical protein
MSTAAIPQYVSSAAFYTVLILMGSKKNAYLQKQQPEQQSLNPSFSHSTLRYL